MKLNSASEPDFHAIFEAVPGLYLVLKPDFTIVAASDSYLEATHTLRSKILGKGVFEVFPDNPDDPDADGVANLTKSLNKVLTNKAADVMPVQKYDIPRPKSKGGGFEERYWSPLNSPVLSTHFDVDFIIHAVVDVTKFVKLKQIERKKTQIAEQLKEQNRLFQAEVALKEKKAEEFKRNEDELLKLDKVKSDFITVASHQLRTPLTAIKWVSEALLNKKGELSKSQQEHYLKQIHESNERMIELVSVLLDVSNIDFGTFATNPQAVKIPAILEHVTEDISTLLTEKDISLTANIDKKLPIIYIDPSWIRIILHNLVINAVKYSKPGKNVTITLKKQSDEVLIKVADHGCGIPQDQQDKIFTKFFRATNAQTLINDGSGLGLYLSKAMAEQAGGKIWFESVENSGTTFYVTLPLKKIAA